MPDNLHCMSFTKPQNANIAAKQLGLQVLQFEGAQKLFQVDILAAEG